MFSFYTDRVPGTNIEVMNDGILEQKSMYRLISYPIQ